MITTDILIENEKISVIGVSLDMEPIRLTNANRPTIKDKEPQTFERLRGEFNKWGRAFCRTRKDEDQRMS